MSRSMNEVRPEARPVGRLRRPTPVPRWLGPSGLTSDGSADDASGHLVLSEHLLTPLVAEADLALPTAADLRAHAAQVLSHYHGAAALDWPLAPWALGQGSQRRSGAWALTQAERWPAEPHTLRTARPAAWAALAAVRAQAPDWAQAPHAALAWVESTLLCWLVLQDGVLQSVRHLRLDGATPAALQARLAPLVGALPAETPVMLAGYGLTAAWTPAQPGLRCLTPLEAQEVPALLWEGAVPLPAEMGGDFLPPAQPLRRWRGPLLAVAALCLALAAQEAWQARAHWQSARDDVAALQSRVGRPAGWGPLAPASPRTAGTAAAPEEAALRVARQALQQPWASALTQLEQVALDDAGRATVAWLAFDLQASRPDVRLEGLAEDRARVLALADRLARTPGWQDVLPTAIQPEEGGRPGLRFTLQARWAPGQASSPTRVSPGERP